MKDYKRKLANCIERAALKALGDAALVRFEETDDGLICDFDMAEPLNPRRFADFNREMADCDLDCAYQLSGFSGVHREADNDGRALQRIHVAAFEDEDDLREYHARMEAAQAGDHKRLGAQMDLYSSAQEVGAGLILWHPKGAMLRYLVEQFGQGAHILNGYQWVYTPHIGRAKLWEVSGHLDFYKDAMYSPIEIDGESYYLKPMNCPFHVSIYNSRRRSYRELPMRLAEYGTVYRYELSGTLNGLTRVRGLTQDDAHIICTPDQIGRELSRALEFSLYMLRAFGLEDFRAYVATKPQAKCIGADEDWRMATEALEEVARAAGLDCEIDEGGGAFYGPKIDLKIGDALGRQWQCSTIQFDFNLPERFGMRYIGADGRQHTPLMVHRALFGSMERFIALLIEYHKGDFPLWLAPEQVGIVPIGDAHADYCRKLAAELKKRGLRASADCEGIHMREKIKRFELERVPIILVVGDRDIAAGGFSVRSRAFGSMGTMDIEKLCALIGEELDKGRPKLLFED